MLKNIDFKKVQKKMPKSAIAILIFEASSRLCKIDKN
jgi:hypothetical protein